MDNNKCPYCGGECEIGTLLPSSCDKMYWVPYGVLTPIFHNPLKDKKLLKKGSIIITSDDLSVIKMQTTVCKNCKMIFINYGDPSHPYKIRD